MNLTVDARQIITSPLSEKNISVLLYCKYKQGDGVAERIKASVATRTVAGSNSTTGGIFLQSITVSGERGRHLLPRHGRYLRVPI